jgi:glycosyltransferase involved in cell wall biosynthesis
MGKEGRVVTAYDDPLGRAGKQPGRGDAPAPSPALRAKVALFSAEFLPYSETFVHDEVTHHVRYQVEIFTGKRLNTERFPFEPVHVGGRLFAATGLSWAFDRLLAEGGFSLAHAHFGPAGLLALRAVRRARLPLVVTFHGHDVPVLGSLERFRPRYLLYGLLAPVLLKHMTLGLCASNELRELLMEMGVPQNKLRIHRLGVDVQRFQPRERLTDAPFEVLMVGRFVAKKGFSYGLRAFARLCAKAPEARPHLTIVGDGPLASQLRALAGSLGVAHQVSFAGVLTAAQVAERLAGANVLLAPSVVALGGDRDSGLMVVKEASAAGAVPVSTWSGGIHEIVTQGKTGLLAPERNVEALAEHLVTLARSPELQASMRQAGRQRMLECYDLALRSQALEEHYDEALQRHSLART